MRVGADVVCFVVGRGVGIGGGASPAAIAALSALVDQISIPLNSMMT